MKIIKLLCNLSVLVSMFITVNSKLRHSKNHNKEGKKKLYERCKPHTFGSECDSGLKCSIDPEDSDEKNGECLVKSGYNCGTSSRNQQKCIHGYHCSFIRGTFDNGVYECITDKGAITSMDQLKHKRK